MMRKIVGPIHIKKLLIGPLCLLIALSNLVDAVSHLQESNDYMQGKGNQEKINMRFSSIISDGYYEKYHILQSMRRKYNHSDVNSSYPDTNNTTRVIQSHPPPRIVINMEKNLEIQSKGKKNGKESRSFTVLHTFLKKFKKTLKSLRPEIRLSECAQKYFFSTSESGTSAKPPHKHGHTSGHDKKKKKKKKKHKHDPDKDSDHITDGIFSSVFALHSDFAGIIYEDYKPYLLVARSVYKNLKSSFETLRQDALMKCTIDYLVARFCIWVDG